MQWMLVSCRSSHPLLTSAILRGRQFSPLTSYYALWVLRLFAIAPQPSSSDRLDLSSKFLLHVHWQFCWSYPSQTKSSSTSSSLNLVPISRLSRTTSPHATLLSSLRFVPSYFGSQLLTCVNLAVPYSAYLAMNSLGSLLSVDTKTAAVCLTIWVSTLTFTFEAISSSSLIAPKNCPLAFTFWIL